MPVERRKGLSPRSRPAVHPWAKAGRLASAEHDGAASFVTMLASMNNLGATTAGVPTAGSTTLRGLQRFRQRWSEMKLKEQFATCRWLAKYNWFIRAVLGYRVGVFGAGFTFADEGGAWSGLDLASDEQFEEQHFYPWRAVVDDVFHEYVTSSNCVAMWRRGGEQAWPHITVLDCETVDYKVVGNVERIKITFKADKDLAGDKANEKLWRKALGDEMFEARVRGKDIAILKNEHKDWNFEALVDGKRSGSFVPPAMISVVDDLDFIELIKVGDWNAAWKRKDVIRHIRQGYEIKSGQMAGQSIQHAKKPAMKDLGQNVAKIEGAADLSTNFDVELGYHLMESDFFGREGQLTYGSRSRLVHWGGFAAMLLMEGFTSIRERGDITAIARNEIVAARQRIAPFLVRIFNHEDFGAETPLRPRFSEASLYSVTELIERVRFASTQALASPQTAREELGYSEARESERMLRSHEEPMAYTPPFESRQGLLRDESGGQEATPGTQPTHDDNPGGRPPAGTPSADA